MDQKKPRLFTPSFIISFCIATFGFFANTILMTAVPLVLSQRMTATKSEIGLVLGFSTIGIIVIRPFLGYLLDKLGRKVILFISLGLGAVVNFLFLLAKTPFDILLVRIIQIIPFAASETALTTIATDIVPLDRRGEGLSYFTTCSTLAIAIGPGIGIALYHSSWYGWPFVLSGIIGIISFVLGFLIKIPNIKLTKTKFSFPAVFDKRVLGVAIVGGIAFLGAAGMYSYSTLYGAEIGLKSENVSIAFTIFAISLLGTRLLTSKTMDRKGPTLSGALSLSMFGAGLAIMGLWRELPGFLLGACVLGGGMGIILPTALSMALELVPPNRRGVCNGLVYAGSDIGGSLGAYLMGATADIFHKYSSAYILFAGIEFLAVILFLFVTIPSYYREKRIVANLQED